MKSLKNNQQGIAHLFMILAFVLVIAGVTGFAYTRINSSKKNNSVATTQPAAQNSEDQETEDDKATLGDNQDESKDDPINNETPVEN